MRRNKLYFKNKNAEICYDFRYFEQYMKENNLSEMEVFEAQPEIVGGGIFFCNKHSFCGDDTSETCGRNNCEDYCPRNKENGVCVHHRHVLYTYGEKTTLKL